MDRFLLELCPHVPPSVCRLCLGGCGPVEPPDTAFLQTFINGQDYCVSVNDAQPDDRRDSGSLYVNARNSCQRKTIFKFEPTVDGYFVQAVDIRTAAGVTANGWYASPSFRPQPSPSLVLLHHMRSNHDTNGCTAHACAYSSRMWWTSSNGPAALRADMVYCPYFVVHYYVRFSGPIKEQHVATVDAWDPL